MSISDSSIIRVFFSWQSDSPKETNSTPMRNALKEAKNAIKNKIPQTIIELDEATRNTSGSPNISAKIFEKIDAAQVFVADITKVTPIDSKRPSANPNVLIELGYAIAQLGWDRIILLFNEAYGKIPDDLPFDIIQNRVSKYKIQVGDTIDGQKQLNSLLTVAVAAIIEINPKFPSEIRGVSPEKIKHDRDVKNITWILEQIHIPTLQDYIQGLPRYIDDRIFFFWEDFKAVATSKLVHLYDQILEEAVCDLFNAWDTTFSFYYRYQSSANGQQHFFSNPGDAPLDASQQADWDQIVRAAADMDVALKKILDRIRLSYLEINIDELSSRAWKNNHEYLKEFFQ